MATKVAKLVKHGDLWVRPDAKTACVIFRAGGLPVRVTLPEVKPEAEGPQRAALRAWDERLAARRAKLMLEGKPDVQRWVVPQPEDFVQVTFRALSQRVIPGHWLDFTKEGVLEAAVPLLKGTTVIKNHWMWDAEEFLGVVADAYWDGEGANSGGVPGINADLMIDALWNPKMARGLLMEPPAINQSSVRVTFEFEYSHPELIADKGYWAFYDLRGEEVNGQIVRYVVTKILKFPEYSLVPEGADDLARRQPDAEPDDFEEEDGDESAGQKKKKMAAAFAPPAPTAEEKTVKLTQAQIAALGLSLPPETDVPEADVINRALDRIAEMEGRAEIGRQALDALRADVRREARIAECIADGAALPGAVESVIGGASFAQLQELQEFYKKKAAQQIPPGGRSSVTEAAPLAQAPAGRVTIL